MCNMYTYMFANSLMEKNLVSTLKKATVSKPNMQKGNLQ